MEKLNHKVVYEKNGELEEVLIDPNDFEIKMDMLEGELCRIPRLMLQHGLVEAMLRAEVGRKEARLEQGYAALDAEIRANPGDEKLTEVKIKNKVISTVAYQGLVESLTESRANYSIMRWVMVSLQQKSEALRALSYRDNALIKADSRIN